MFHAYLFYIPAPAIRIVDEQGNEIRDRYYKIGSTIDLTCQVAISFIKNSTTNAPEPNILLNHYQMEPNYHSHQQQQQQHEQHHQQPSIHENIIDVSDKTLRNNNGASSRDNSLFKKILWQKDGENISKDALFNFR